MAITNLVPVFWRTRGENGATTAAAMCIIDRGIAPASAPANAWKGSKAVAHSPLDIQSSVNRLTSGFGSFGGCLANSRRTDAAPTDDVAESLRRGPMQDPAIRIGVFCFFQGHSFLYIVLTGICVKDVGLMKFVDLRL